MCYRFLASSFSSIEDLAAKTYRKLRQYRIVSFAFVKHGCNEIFYSFSKLKDYSLIRIHRPVLGPTNLVEHVYFHSQRTYSVIIDTDIACFDDFVEHMCVQPPNKVLVPNRAVLSPNDSVNVSRFNSFLGPMCDFHAPFFATYVPATAGFFATDPTVGYGGTLDLIDSRGEKVRYANDDNRTTLMLAWPRDCFCSKKTA